MKVNVVGKFIEARLSKTEHTTLLQTQSRLRKRGASYRTMAVKSSRVNLLSRRHKSFKARPASPHIQDGMYPTIH